ncbi:MAG: UDP-3-O-(3-hydroxymyristoyl)glucosamine N-acyltransferase [Verrucomicrobia bacterium]|nr:MAG: UDP-3-O-(3-hydroxymyristoyl)glucosamine N-acyltransferase [Verrucomicrobiota bacterium]
MTYTATQIAGFIGGQVIGDGSTLLHRFAPVNSAEPGDLTFAENEAFFEKAIQSAASAILIDSDISTCSKTCIRVPQARVGFAKALALFFPEPAFSPGIHPSAVVAPSSKIDSTAHVGPHCIVGERVEIGPRAVLQGLNFIGEDSVIGEDTRLFPNTTLYAGTRIGKRVRIHSGAVLGSDGFGYVFDAGAHLKIPQVGTVIIHDDVEIGANTTIDRGAMEPTVIGRGTKIDNLVQIAHNVVVGEHSIIVAQAGVAGSTKLGRYVILAGQVGVAGHLEIGDRVTVAAQSGVMHNIPDGQKWLGSPAQPDRTAKRVILASLKLPEILQRIAKLERSSKPKPDTEA